MIDVTEMLLRKKEYYWEINKISPSCLVYNAYGDYIESKWGANLKNGSDNFNNFIPVQALFQAVSQ